MGRLICPVFCGGSGGEETLGESVPVLWPVEVCLEAEQCFAVCLCIEYQLSSVSQTKFGDELFSGGSSLCKKGKHSPGGGGGERGSDVLMILHAVVM